MSHLNKIISRFIPSWCFYDGNQLDDYDLDLKKYIDDRIAAANPGGSSSYLVYTALLNATSSAQPPDVIVLENTLYGNPVWTYSGSPISWVATLNGAFTNGKTVIMPFGQNAFGIIGIGFSAPFDYGYSMFRVDDDNIRFELYKTSDYSNTDPNDILSINSYLLIEIRVYP